MTFNDMWEILLCEEEVPSPSDIAEHRLQALIAVIKDDKLLEKTDDRLIKTLKVRGAIPMLRRMFGVRPNESTTTGTTGGRDKTKIIGDFERSSRSIFG